MKQSGKKKAKKKKTAVPHAGHDPPLCSGHSASSSSIPYQEEVRREDARKEEVYRTLTENSDPSTEDLRQARWCAAHGRTARSQSWLSHQMGLLGMAGHLARNEAAPIPRFDSPIHQEDGPPTAFWRSKTYGFPPESGVRPFKNRLDRNWARAAEYAIQQDSMREAQAQHYALARAGHDLKCQCLQLEVERNQLHCKKLARRLEMEGLMIHMWHCALHMILDQGPEHCICCENNHARICRLKLQAIEDDEALQHNFAAARVLEENRRLIDEATRGAKLEAERAEGQLNFRITSGGDYVPSHYDDSPYSTDRFEEDEKQDSDLPPQVPIPVLPAVNDDPPEYEAPESEFENFNFK